MPLNTSTRLSSGSHKHNPEFPSTLQILYKTLQNDQPNATAPITITQDDLTYLSIRLALRDNFDAASFRSQLASHLDIPAMNILQVVGDSGTPYSSSAIQKIRALLQDLLTPTTVIEYGYTASANDVNWIVNDLISTTPDLASRTIGNVVSESGKVVREWGCEATSRVKTFVLVYDEARDTKFGDDIFASDDGMMSLKSDVMVCVEGGVQSFEQVVGVLMRNVRVVAVTGKGTREKDENKFSAAGLLRRLKEALDGSEGAQRRMERLIQEVKDEETKKGRADLVVRIERAFRRLVTNPGNIEAVEVLCTG